MDLPAPTQSDAVNALVTKSKRTRVVPLRREFLQHRTKQRVMPGPLHALVASHDERALDLYLLVHLVAVGKPYKVTLEAGGWARALGLQSTSRHATVSRAWRRLADLRLISRGRQGRTACIRLLRENGSGSLYSRPTGEVETDDRYLNIPLEYWTEEWYNLLRLPGKALLLIALSLTDDFYLPFEWTREWYGISADTAQRGLEELLRAEILSRVVNYKPAPLTTQGWTVDYRYTLQPPFGPKNAESPPATPGEGAKK